MLKNLQRIQGNAVNLAADAAKIEIIFLRKKTKKLILQFRSLKHFYSKKDQNENSIVQ